MLKARQKFFGIDNVDVNTAAVKNDKVIASWATNTTYVVSIMGRVVLLDSYITTPQLPSSPIDRRYAPVLPQDFIDVRPEAIFLGHGHGDHADNAAYIAKWTNATIYASPETCLVMQQDVVRMADRPESSERWRAVPSESAPVNCVGVVPTGSRPGQYNEGPNAGLLKSSATKLATPLDSLVCVLAFKFVHSGTAPADPSFTHATLSDLADPRYAGRVIDHAGACSHLSGNVPVRAHDLHPAHQCREQGGGPAQHADDGIRRRGGHRSRSSTSSSCAAATTSASSI